MSRRKSASGSMSRCSSTPALHAAVNASSAIGSHAPNTKASSSASGMKSLISGERFSVRFPKRIVAICVSDPIGLERPRRMLSTPAMNVVATAPRPGVRIPSLPVAGRIVERAPAAALFALFDEDCTYLISFHESARNASATAQPARLVGISESKRLRLCLYSWCGLVVHEGDTLNHSDPRGHGEKNDDECQYPSIQRQAEECLRNGEQNHALRTLKDSDLRVEAERLRPRACVGREERPDDSGETDDNHWHASVHRAQRVKHPEATEDGAVRQSVERRVEKRAKGRAAIRPARDCSIQHIEQRGEAEEEPADGNVAGPVDHTARDGTGGPNSGDGVRMDSTPDQPVRDRIDDA